MVDDSSILVGNKDTFRTLVLVNPTTSSVNLIQFDDEDGFQRIFIPEKDRSKLAEIIKGE